MGEIRNLPLMFRKNSEEMQKDLEFTPQVVSQHKESI
jgi:hypothetical protein